jgi:hypothetical protein
MCGRYVRTTAVMLRQPSLGQCQVNKSEKRVAGCQINKCKPSQIREKHGFLMLTVACSKYSRSDWIDIPSPPFRTRSCRRRQPGVLSGSRASG